MKPGQLAAYKESAIINTLRSCQLFDGLGIDDLRCIAQVAIPKRLEKGEYLFRQGEPAPGFYVVQRGTINVHRAGAGGREQVIHLFHAGDSFGEVVLTSDTGFPADARATEPSQVLLIQKREFLSLLQSKPDLGLRMLASMSKHLRVLVEMLSDLTLKDVETRLANWLLRRCVNPNNKSPVEVVLPATKRILAAELGTVSETLSRTLAKFRRRGLIRVAGRVLTVVDPTALLALLRNSELK